LPAAILRDLGVRRVRLLTNNPRKARALSDAGIEVVARIPCEAAPTPYSLAYLRTKKERMGHALGLRERESTDQAEVPRASSDMVGSHGRDESRAFEIAWQARRGIEVQL